MVTPSIHAVSRDGARFMVIAIASFAALATMAGLPAGVMGVYISINTLCDMGATCVNVIGDMAGCVVLQEKIDLE